MSLRVHFKITVKKKFGNKAQVIIRCEDILSVCISYSSFDLGGLRWNLGNAF